MNKVVPRKQDNPHKFVFYGLEIVVGSDVVTTTAIDGTTVPGSTTTTDGTTAGSQDTTTTITSTTSTNTETSVTGDGKTLYGDVNCDGVVRIGDVVLLNRYLAKNAQVTPQGLLNADCEKDNKIDGKDSVKIKKYLALIIKDTELGKASV